MGDQSAYCSRSKLSGEGLGWLKEGSFTSSLDPLQKTSSFQQRYLALPEGDEPEEYFCLEMQTTYEGNGFGGTRNPEETL